jgi:hypothetical protein
MLFLSDSKVLSIIFNTIHYCILYFHYINIYYLFMLYTYYIIYDKYWKNVWNFTKGNSELVVRNVSYSCSVAHKVVKKAYVHSSSHTVIPTALAAYLYHAICTSWVSNCEGGGPSFHLASSSTQNIWAHPQ